MTDPTPTAQSVISLREVSSDTVIAICLLKVHESQTKFVAGNSYSIAEAYFSDHAWFRAIYADETPVGFLMLHDDQKNPSTCSGAS